ncbi:type VI secretion system contractile sheath large subunit, partial [Pseudoalteromonas citrea]
SGTVKWNKKLKARIDDRVDEIAAKLSEQLSQIMQKDTFQEIEGSWLCLQKLILNSALGTAQKVNLLNISKDELLEQFEDAPAVDRSPI